MNYIAKRATGAAVETHHFDQATWFDFIFGAGTPMPLSKLKEELEEAILLAIDCHDEVPEQNFRDAITDLRNLTVADIPAIIGIEGAEIAYKIEEDAE